MAEYSGNNIIFYKPGMLLKGDSIHSSLEQAARFLQIITKPEKTIP